jgi:hypothetical protein
MGRRKRGVDMEMKCKKAVTKKKTESGTILIHAMG